MQSKFESGGCDAAPHHRLFDPPSRPASKLRRLANSTLLNRLIYLLGAGAIVSLLVQLHFKNPDWYKNSNDLRGPRSNWNWHDQKAR